MAASDYLNPALFRGVHVRQGWSQDRAQRANFPHSMPAYSSITDHRVVAHGYHVMPTKLGKYKPQNLQNIREN